MTHSFVRSGRSWTYEGPLGWGGQVALDGDLAMVSYTRMAIPAVTFYRWQGNAWSVEQVIETPVGARPPTGRLDTPIALLGDRMAFGVPDSPADGGQVHFFDRIAGSWTHRQTIADWRTATGWIRDRSVRRWRFRQAISWPGHPAS